MTIDLRFAFILLSLGAHALGAGALLREERVVRRFGVEWHEVQVEGEPVRMNRARTKTPSVRRVSAAVSPGPASPETVSGTTESATNELPLVTAGEVGIRIEYPYLSRVDGEEGRVIVRLKVASDGRVEGCEIESSSGFERLDSAALEASCAHVFDGRTGDFDLAVRFALRR